MPTQLSPASREYRALMWGTVALGGLGLLVAIAGVRGLVRPRLGLLGVSEFLACVLVAGWFGLKARSRALLDRERAARYQMIVMLAAQLSRQSDAKLREIAGRGGPAGEAAALVLEGRAERR
ncbi:MAG TPA: hypothetical protein VFK09_01685 [Gemmatimonadales bacterium]|nr:hypothetical protein [Gemmatimonadales bacterium]